MELEPDHQLEDDRPRDTETHHSEATEVVSVNKNHQEEQETTLTLQDSEPNTATAGEVNGIVEAGGVRPTSNVSKTELKSHRTGGKGDTETVHVTSESGVEEKKGLNTHQPRWVITTEIGIICAVIVVVWVLSAVVCILLSLPDNTVQTPQNSSSSSSIFTCSPRVSYEGEACLSELRVLQECFSGPLVDNETIYIPSNIDQEDMEDRASMFLTTGLFFLRPGPECDTAIRPFLCLFLFGSCDTNNQSHHTSVEDCVRIRDEVCPSEWMQAVGLLGEGVLPNCEELPTTETEECIVDLPTVNCSELALSGSEDIPMECANTNPSTLFNCSQGFYRNEDDVICLPDCGEWVVSNDRLGRTVVVILFTLQALGSAAVFLFVSLTWQRKTVFVFPVVYLVYICIDVVAVSIVVIIGFFDKEALFCASRNLIDSIRDTPTPFCTFSGIVYYYVIMQLFMWMAFLSLTLCFSILFPLKYKQLKKQKKLRYWHIATVIVGILLPLITSLVHLKDGYTIISHPTVVCSPQNVDSIFYGFAIPISVLLAIGLSAFFLAIYTVLREFIVMKFKLATTKWHDFDRAQLVKLSCVLCYCIFLLVFYQAILVVANKANFNTLQDYFICGGVSNQGNDNTTMSQCAAETVDNPDNGLVLFDDVSVAGLVFFSLVPLVMLISVNLLSVKF